jgi:hypothetical protein
MGWSGKHRAVRCHLPDNPVFPEKSSVYTTVVAALRLSQAQLAKIYWTVRAEHQIVRCEGSQRLSATSACCNSQMEHRTVQCPHQIVWCLSEMESDQSAILRLLYCALSGAPPDSPVHHRTVRCTHRQGRLGASK